MLEVGDTVSLLIPLFGDSNEITVHIGTLCIVERFQDNNNRVVLKVPEKCNFFGILGERHKALLDCTAVVFVSRNNYKIGNNYKVFGNDCKIEAIDQNDNTDYRMKLRFDNDEILWTTLDGRLHSWMNFCILEEA